MVMKLEPSCGSLKSCFSVAQLADSATLCEARSTSATVAEIWTRLLLHQLFSSGEEAHLQPCAMLQTVVRRLFRPNSATGVPAAAWIGQARQYAAAAASLGSSNKLKLRDYQQECIKSVVLSLKRGHKRVGISLATGSGKTVIIFHKFK